MGELRFLSVKICETEQNQTNQKDMRKPPENGDFPGFLSFLSCEIVVDQRLLN